MLAFSSVAQIGYITLGIGIGSETGLTARPLCISSITGSMKGALFLLVGGIAYRTGTVTVDAIAGLAPKMPLTFAGIVVAGLSMVGVPGTVGFISKWYLVAGAIEQGLWWLAVLIVGSSLLTFVYFGRLVEAAYFRKASSAHDGMADPPPPC